MLEKSIFLMPLTLLLTAFLINFFFYVTMKGWKVYGSIQHVRIINSYHLWTILLQQVAIIKQVFTIDIHYFLKIFLHPNRLPLWLMYTILAKMVQQIPSVSPFHTFQSFHLLPQLIFCFQTYTYVQANIFSFLNQLRQ